MWTADKHWVMYKEVVSPEMHTHFKQLDDAANQVMPTLEHAKHRTVTCVWQDEQRHAAPLPAGALEAPAACRSPPQEAAASAAAASQPPADSGWQAEWSWGLLSVGDC